MNEKHTPDAVPQGSFIAIAAPTNSFPRHSGVVTKQLLTDIEVAQHLSVSVSTVRRWRLKGGGPRWIRIGSSIRYFAADLEAYLGSVPSGGAREIRVN